jgi:hypothetical protein
VWRRALRAFARSVCRKPLAVAVDVADMAKLDGHKIGHNHTDCTPRMRQFSMGTIGYFPEPRLDNFRVADDPGVMRPDKTFTKYRRQPVVASILRFGAVERFVQDDRRYAQPDSQ